MKVFVGETFDVFRLSNSEVKFTRCVFRNQTTLTDCSTIFQDCEFQFEEDKIAILVIAGSLKVKNCRFVVAENHVNKSGRQEEQIGILGLDPNLIKVEDSTFAGFYGWKSSGIRILGSLSSDIPKKSKLTDVEIHRNNFFDLQGVLSSTGIELQACDGITVSNNFFDKMTIGIFLDSSDGIKVSENVMSNVQTGIIDKSNPSLNMFVDNVIEVTDSHENHDPYDIVFPTEDLSKMVEIVSNPDSLNSVAPATNIIFQNFQDKNQSDEHSKKTNMTTIFVFVVLILVIVVFLYLNRK